MKKRIQIEGEPLYLSYTHTHSLGRMSERDYCCREIIFMFSGFTFGTDSISEEFAGFYPLWFPREKFFVSLVSYVLLLCMLFSQLKYPKITMLS